MARPVVWRQGGQVNARTVWLAVCAVALAACAAAPRWDDDVLVALRQARGAQQELVVYFALPGRELSDRMQASLQDGVVLEALGDGGFASAIADANARKNLYTAWIGFGEGMGIAVLDGQGRCYAARPGPQDPAELAAFLRLCTSLRGDIAALRGTVASSACTPQDQHRLGCLYLQLGCREPAAELLLAAATAGVADARHRLARLHALEGDLIAARRWLAHAPKTPQALVTEGYVLFKERKHEAAAQTLEQALQTNQLGDERQRALLYLGKALHEGKRDDRAVPLLTALAAEGRGTTFEAAARHTLSHIKDPQHGHTH